MCYRRSSKTPNPGTKDAEPRCRAAHSCSTYHARSDSFLQTSTLRLDAMSSETFADTRFQIRFIHPKVVDTAKKPRLQDDHQHLPIFALGEDHSRGSANKTPTPVNLIGSCLASLSRVSADCRPRQLTTHQSTICTMKPAEWCANKQSHIPKTRPSGVRTSWDGPLSKPSATSCRSYQAPRRTRERLHSRYQAALAQVNGPCLLIGFDRAGRSWLRGLGRAKRFL